MNTQQTNKDEAMKFKLELWLKGYNQALKDLRGGSDE